MTKERLKPLLPYAGLPVIMVLVWLLCRDRVDIVSVLLRETLIVFGYVISVGDIRRCEISNRSVLAMAGAWAILLIPQVILRYSSTISIIIDGAIGALFGGLLFLIVYFISRKGLGGGDVKFMAASGLYLGAAGVLPTMLVGSVLAAIAGLVLIISKKIDKKDAIPLAPFLYVGMVLTTIFR